MTVAMGQGARAGILFRNAEAIERMRDIDTVVVDKTGTLTLGRPALTDFIAEGIAPRRSACARRGRGAAFRASDRASNRRGRQGARFATPNGGSFRANNGLGVQAEIDGKRVLVGSRNFLAQHGVDTESWHHRGRGLAC